MSRIIFCVAAMLGCWGAMGQDLEPRRYAALPTGMNALALGYGFSEGNIVADAALPVEDFSLKTHMLIAGYAHTFGMWGKLARVAVSLPFTALAGNVKIQGRDTSISRAGFNDLQLRWGINLLGSPAMDRKAFAKFRQGTILGFSMVVNIPTGLYHNDKVVNTGSNRWAVKPEVGISQRINRFYGELYTGVWFYAPNDEYMGHQVQRQEPVFSLQGHACYQFRNTMWLSVDGTWFNGGQNFVDGRSRGELFDNWRVGATWSTPIAKGHSLKLQFHVGAFATRGYDYNTVSLAYQYIFFR
ncbi:transporter [Paraflavitalea sp. CAU 1676]|uniref:transporter n=1 Tax=Paraflavitalea sp. CAU 1676 TaxID=3032598 RepID=UPI0023DA065E|nr:transporter [Paraflavitalea sp. CAU 1676]MDF2191595.1 transporter [Paraflavitalea sp. CAU 1676]